MSDTFSRYHPLVNFLFFTLVLVYSMVLMHPVCLAVSLTGAIWYAVVLNGPKAVRFSLKVTLPVLLLAAVVNPAFNHAGVTILCYLPTGNPLTLESILYGLAAGAMLCAVLMWFMCYNAVMTSDKFVYLFGRVIPPLSSAGEFSVFHAGAGLLHGADASGVSGRLPDGGDLVRRGA